MSSTKTTHDTLVFVPTYNEKENVTKLCQELLALNLPIDILFLDDNSPDGTGQAIDQLSKEYENVSTIHRSGKLGIGSAHFDGINWAYEHNYRTLITMDCDFTHPPQRVAELLKQSAESPDAAIVVGSRYMSKNSLPGWNMFRRGLTNLGHLVTLLLLRIPYDATGALRLYRLDMIPRHAFTTVRSGGYSFFFESLYIFHRNGYPIKEFPIDLPARTYGNSKMSLREVFRSIKLLLITFFVSIFNPEKFLISAPLDPKLIDPSQVDPQNWDDYWNMKKKSGGILYDAVASIYRKMIIGPALGKFLRKHFNQKSTLLHAGCGSGQVDSEITGDFQITGMDISVNALEYYKRTHGDQCKVLHGSIFEIPLANESVDGVYNLGVMEHFTEEEIDKILKEISRVTKKDGKMVFFWPPEYGLSVNFLKILSWTLRTFFGKKSVKFHPDEITRIQSKNHAISLIEKAGLHVKEYYFGPLDCFTQVVLVASKSTC
jgi:dolichol-phosphate mannosyltransferase